MARFLVNVLLCVIVAMSCSFFSPVIVLLAPLAPLAPAPPTKHKQFVIHISPGGYKGIYLFGIINFIKENYDLDTPPPPAAATDEGHGKYIFSGASAGSWNALMLCMNYSFFETNPHAYAHFKTAIIHLFAHRPLISLTQGLNEYMRAYYNTPLFFDPHTLQRQLRIDATEFAPMKFPFFLQKTVLSDFQDVHDTLDACMASSHVPFVTNPRLFHSYKSKLFLDGAILSFLSNPHRRRQQEDDEVGLTIHHNMWRREFYRGRLPRALSEIPNLINIGQDFQEMYDFGYNDTRRNRHVLDKLFLLKKKENGKKEIEK